MCDDSVGYLEFQRGGSVTRRKILCVAGARPNFMKIAPIHEALARDEALTSRIVHTGQHYDAGMSDVFFRELGMPEPHAHLGVGSGTHAKQTARVMLAFEDVVLDEDPDVVLVVGDVNSTLACALVAAKLHVPVGHVEAGLRSFDDRMPEEINRRLTDQVASWLFVTEQSGLDNLRKEGVPDEKVHFVGNVMIDSLMRCRELAGRRRLREDLGLEASEYVLMTMHRPSNVDRRGPLNRVLNMIEALTEDWTVVFPMHPRTRESLEDHGLWERAENVDRLRVLEPLGYLDFLHLLEDAGVVVTDSGGIQEETTFLQVPCLTVRENTERPVTVDVGTNELIELDPTRVAARVREIMRGGLGRETGVPELWDGKASERIVDVLRSSAPGDA